MFIVMMTGLLVDYNLKFKYNDRVVPTHECTREVAFFRLVNRPGRVVSMEGLDSYSVKFDHNELTITLYEGCLKKIGEK